MASDQSQKNLPGQHQPLLNSGSIHDLTIAQPEVDRESSRYHVACFSLNLLAFIIRLLLSESFQL
jgi:hypothetical protein